MRLPDGRICLLLCTICDHVPFDSRVNVRVLYLIWGPLHFHFLAGVKISSSSFLSPPIRPACVTIPYSVPSVRIVTVIMDRVHLPLSPKNCNSSCYLSIWQVDVSQRENLNFFDARSTRIQSFLAGPFSPFCPPLPSPSPSRAPRNFAPMTDLVLDETNPRSISSLLPLPLPPFLLQSESFAKASSSCWGVGLQPRVLNDPEITSSVPRTPKG